MGARKRIDIKIVSLVLDRMSRHKGGVLSSTHVEQIGIEIPPLKPMRGSFIRERKRAKVRNGAWARRAPLGLVAVDEEGWFNALMQFIVFVPGLPELFSFLPRSLVLLRDFLDLYEQDQGEKKLLCSADGLTLFHFLCLKFPNFYFVDLFAYLLFILGLEWKIYQRLVDVKNGADHLFLTERELKKQFFTELGFCYDLDAFIERRPDGERASYIAYVKVGGIWYQCDDERIFELRSDFLPLQRGALAHFKKIKSPEFSPGFSQFYR